VILFVTGNIGRGEMEATGKIHQFKLQKIASFTEVEPLNVYHSTHTSFSLA